MLESCWPGHEGGALLPDVDATAHGERLPMAVEATAHEQAEQAER